MTIQERADRANGKKFRPNRSFMAWTEPANPALLVTELDRRAARASGKRIDEMPTDTKTLEREYHFARRAAVASGKLIAFNETTLAREYERRRALLDRNGARPPLSARAQKIADHLGAGGELRFQDADGDEVRTFGEATHFVML